MEDPVHVTLNTSASAMSPCVYSPGPDNLLSTSRKAASFINVQNAQPFVKSMNHNEKKNY